jgi:L-ascorbate metabolism protein UlaG (beta-lactamase superfamily)
MLARGAPGDWFAAIRGGSMSRSEGNRPRASQVTVPARGRFAALASLVLFLPLLAGCGSSLARADGERFGTPRPNAITFWGHACTYIDIDGFGIVTDPVFEKHLLFRTRKIAAPPPAAYAGARLVLISHAHDDHLSPATLRTFPTEVVVLCPEPSAKHADDSQRTVHTMRLGDEYPFPGGRIIAVPAHHPGGKHGIRSGHDGRALGYIIETPRGVIYYSGDAGLFDGIADIGQKHRPRIAIVNVNSHLISTDAVLAACWSRAEIVIPAHFGAYGFLVIDEFKQVRSSDTLRAGLGATLVPLTLGQCLPLPAPSDVSTD